MGVKPTPHPPFGHLLPQGEKGIWNWSNELKMIFSENAKMTILENLLWAIFVIFRKNCLRQFYDFGGHAALCPHYIWLFLTKLIFHKSLKSTFPLQTTVCEKYENLIFGEGQGEAVFKNLAVTPYRSSGASRHLLPQGEKEKWKNHMTECSSAW